jgi:hypothetical protein
MLKVKSSAALFGADGDLIDTASLFAPTSSTDPDDATQTGDVTAAPATVPAAVDIGPGATYNENLTNAKTTPTFYPRYYFNGSTLPITFNGADQSSTGTVGANNSYFVVAMNGSETASQSVLGINHTGGQVKPGDSISVKVTNINPSSGAQLALQYMVVTDEELSSWTAASANQAVVYLTSTDPTGIVQFTVPSKGLDGNPSTGFSADPDIVFQVVNYNNATTTYTITMTDLSNSGRPNPSGLDVWNGTQNGNFNDPTHWSTGTVPTVSNIAQIGTVGNTVSFTVTSPIDETLGGLANYGTNAQLHVTGGTFDVKQGSVNNYGIIVVDLGTVSFEVPVVNNSSGTITANKGALIDITGAVTGHGVMNVNGGGCNSTVQATTPSISLGTAASSTCSAPVPTSSAAASITATSSCLDHRIAPRSTPAAAICSTTRAQVTNMSGTPATSMSRRMPAPAATSSISSAIRTSSMAEASAIGSAPTAATMRSLPAPAPNT